MVINPDIFKYINYTVWRTSWHIGGNAVLAETGEVTLNTRQTKPNTRKVLQSIRHRATGCAVIDLQNIPQWVSKFSDML